MPITTAQRRARRLPFWWTIDMTGMVASHAAMVVMVPALAEDGDLSVRRTLAPRIAYRGALTDTLPVRTALGPYPTRAFDLSIGSVMSVLSDGELSTSHALLNNPSCEGAGAIPPEVGVGQPDGIVQGARVATGCDIPGNAGGRHLWPIAEIAAQTGGTSRSPAGGGIVEKAALLSHLRVVPARIGAAAVAWLRSIRFGGGRDAVAVWRMAGHAVIGHALAAGGGLPAHRARLVRAANVALSQRAERRPEGARRLPAWACNRLPRRWRGNHGGDAGRLQEEAVVSVPAASIVSTQFQQIEPPAGSALSDMAAQGRRQGAASIAEGRRCAPIASAALRNASSIGQARPAAGTGNVTSNAFVLRPPAGTLF